MIITNKWYQIRLLLLVQSDLGLLCLLMFFLSELFGFGMQKVNTYIKKVKRLYRNNVISAKKTITINSRLFSVFDGFLHAKIAAFSSELYFKSHRLPRIFILTKMKRIKSHLICSFLFFKYQTNMIKHAQNIK